MRIARLRTADGARLALGLDGNELVRLDAVLDDCPTDPVELLAWPDRDRVTDQVRAAVADPGTRRRLVDAGAIRGLDDAVLAPPVVAPSKVICLALNYHAHAAEGGFVPPERPVLFLKGPNTLCGHGEEVVVPPASRRIDHEGELAVVIGRRARHLSIQDWPRVVAGYTIMNDLTARDLQLADIERGHPWDLSKSFDGYGPTGPWLVSADEVADPQALDLTVTVDGEVRQRASTGEMIFGVGELLRFLSSVLTLEPGDVIATGTPEGIGPVGDGSTVTVTISGIGELRNRIRFADP
ncbi:fumarylacetoacetate hydrolase family protein [Actinophytocola sp.]|uniref:fumarylacetoacetate hydrolase family protein n=1 Tax=Actinophytocola sp. TaxID=1872138 RepID=UPI003D6B5335